MKKYLFAILLLLITSCSEMTNYLLANSETGQKVKFQMLLEENTFDSDIARFKVENDSKIVEVIRTEGIKDLVTTVAGMSTETDNVTIVHYAKFSSPEKFIVDEEVIKEFAKKKGCNLVVYAEANDVSDYYLYNDLKTIKIRDGFGKHFFNAFFYSKVKVEKTHKENIEE